MHSLTGLGAADGGVKEKSFAASASGVLFSRTDNEIADDQRLDCGEELRLLDFWRVAVIRINNQHARLRGGQWPFVFSLATVFPLIVGFAFLFHFSVSLRERVLIFSDGYSP